MTEHIFNLISLLQQEDPEAKVIAYFTIEDTQRIEYDIFFKGQRYTFTDPLNMDSWAKYMILTVDKVIEEGGFHA